MILWAFLISTLCVLQFLLYILMFILLFLFTLHSFSWLFHPKQLTIIALTRTIIAKPSGTVQMKIYFLSPQSCQSTFKNVHQTLRSCLSLSRSIILDDIKAANQTSGVAKIHHRHHRGGLGNAPPKTLKLTPHQTHYHLIELLANRLTNTQYLHPATGTTLTFEWTNLHPKK